MFRRFLNNKFADIFESFGVDSAKEFLAFEITVEFSGKEFLFLSADYESAF
jgi:hypothetical protein